MPNQQGKSHAQEKREGRERRQQDNRVQRQGIERRNCPERRQTSITEISYFEWASHFVKFQSRALSDKAEELDEDIPDTAAHN